MLCQHSVLNHAVINGQVIVSHVQVDVILSSVIMMSLPVGDIGWPISHSTVQWQNVGKLLDGFPIINLMSVIHCVVISDGCISPRAHLDVIVSSVI
jgi:hypothetical protein